MKALVLAAAIGSFVPMGASAAEPSPMCWTAARRVVTIMLEVAAENNLTIVAPASDGELAALLQKNAETLEARGACDIIAVLPDSLLREIVLASLRARES